MYLFLFNYYVEKKYETLSKRALQDSKDQMSMVVSTNSEVTCNSQAGSSEYLGPTDQSPVDVPIAANVVQEAFPQQEYNRPSISHFPSPSKQMFRNVTHQSQLSNFQQMLSIFDQNSFITRQYLVSHFSNLLDNNTDTCSSFFAGTSDFMSNPELSSFHNLSQPSIPLITQTQSHINTLIASTAQYKSATTNFSEARSHTSTSTSQSQQYPIVSAIPLHNRKHTHISSPPVPPSSKRPKVLSPVSSDAEHTTPTTEAIRSHQNSSSFDSVGSEYSISSDTVDDQETSYINSLKENYAKLEYPILMQDYLPSKYFDLLIVDSIERSCVNLEDIGILPNGSQARCVLIEGSSGVGKTMLLHHLAKQWGAGDMFTQYKLVVLLTIDDKWGIYDNYERLVLTFFDQQYMSREDKFLFLLDIHHQSHFPHIAYFFSHNFQNASIIFTCRSEWPHSNQDVLIQSVDRYLRVIGFNEESMQAMIASCCPGLEENQYWIKTYPFATALTYRPLYCAMLIQLCKNSRLPDSLPNLTELYRLFILCSISLHVNKQIEYYSDLQGEDENTFKQLIASSCQSMQQNISEQSSFGLVKSNSSGVNTFIHPSIKEYFEALHRCNAEIKNDPFSEIYLFLASQKKFWYNRFFNIINWSYDRTHGILLLHWLLFESQSLSPVVESGLVGLEGFSLEADPLEWYIAGWCLQNIAMVSKLICDVPYSFNRALCLEMLYNGTKHNPTSSKCKAKLIRISLNGDNQLSECLQWLTQMRPVIENVLTLKIMGTLRSSVEGLNLDTYFPSLKTLDVTSHEVFSSVWQQFTISLPKLKRLTTLCIPDQRVHFSKTKYVSFIS